MSIRYELIDEFRISPCLHEEIRSLLSLCFPDCEFTQSRNYLKQRPQRRLLVWEAEKLVGHLGLEYRTIGLKPGPATIFGLIEVCVEPEHRGAGVASGMIRQIEVLGQENGVDFLMLFAHDRRLYERTGFHHPGNPLRWLMIDEHESLGMDEQALEELMIKELSDRRWPEGLVDLLGYQF